MFYRSIQAETPLCTLLGILHYWAWLLLHQTSTNTLTCSFTSTQFHLWALLMLPGKIKDLDPHTPTTFILPTVSQFCILLTVPGAGSLPGTPSTCDNSISLKKSLSSAPHWKELTGWRITAERKPFWHFRCGDNQPMDRKSSIRVENCSSTQLVPANICCWN